MKRTAIDARFLSTELAKTRGEVLALAAAFAATGGQSDLDAFKQKKRYQSALERIERELKPGAGGEAAAQAAEVGSSLGRLIGLSANQSLKAALTGGIAGPVIAGALIPVAIELGVMVGGAMLTGVGLAGIGAGIAGQIDNPLVQEAGSRLGQKVGSGFTEATEVFAKPVAELLDGLGKEWDRLALGLKTTFGYLADEIPTLGEGVNGFLDAFIPGLERAAVAAMPLVDTFAHWLPQFGAELAFLFDEMASHADEANDGLKLLLGTISAIIAVADAGIVVFSALSDALKWTTPAIGALIAVGDAGGEASKHLDVAANSTAAAAARAKEAAPSYAELSKRLKETAVTADTLAGEMVDKVINTFLAADEATLGLAESQTRLADTLKKNGRAFDIHSAKGQANRQAILSVVQANIQMYDTMIAAGLLGGGCGEGVRPEHCLAWSSSCVRRNFTQKEIDDLIGKYKQGARQGQHHDCHGRAWPRPSMTWPTCSARSTASRRNVKQVDIVTRARRQHHRPDRAAVGRRPLRRRRPGQLRAAPASTPEAPYTASRSRRPAARRSCHGHGDYARSMGILSEAASWYGAAVQPLMARSRAAAGGWPTGAGERRGGRRQLGAPDRAGDARANLDYNELQAWQRNAEIRQRVGRPR
jgi:hypothetical protein